MGPLGKATSDVMGWEGQGPFAWLTGVNLGFQTHSWLTQRGTAWPWVTTPEGHQRHLLYFHVRK